MIRHSRLEHQFVDEIPEKPTPGQLYISMEYATVVHLCCCGCGHEVVTPLSPAQWRLTYDGESISLNPSVGSWALPCRSHYIIRNGRVIECGQWTDVEVEHGRANDRRKRNVHNSASASILMPETVNEPAASAQAPRLQQTSWVKKLRSLFWS